MGEREREAAVRRCSKRPAHRSSGKLDGARQKVKRIKLLMSETEEREKKAEICIQGKSSRALPTSTIPTCTFMSTGRLKVQHC